MGKDLNELTNYLKEVQDCKFEFAKHDCLIFTNNAWKRMYGFGWADDWVGRYTKETPYGTRLLRKDELRSEYGYFDFGRAVSDKLKRITYIPPRGALVATKKCDRFGVGYALGISLGMKAVFLGNDKLLFLPIDDVEKAWINNDPD